MYDNNTLTPFTTVSVVF